MALRGHAEQRAIAAWSMGWQPARYVSRTERMLPYLVNLLDDPYSAVRYVAWRSLPQSSEYSHLKYDFVGSAEHRRDVTERADQIWRSGRGASISKSLVLFDVDGKFMLSDFERIKAARDDRVIDLAE